MDVDFDRHVILVREAKGNKDRVALNGVRLHYSQCAAADRETHIGEGVP